MKEEVLKNKNGEVLKTKEGEELKDYKLEPGDEFIPLYNSIKVDENEAMVKGKKKIITNHKLKVKTKEMPEVWISLTPTQAASMNKKKDAGVELNQNVWVAYKYTNKYGDQVGVGLKSDQKEAIDFPE